MAKIVGMKSVLLTMGICMHAAHALSLTASSAPARPAAISPDFMVADGSNVGKLGERQWRRPGRPDNNARYVGSLGTSGSEVN